jgi:hypothetical protein
MRFLEQLKGWFREESREARAWVDEATADGHAALGRAERRISADPSERLAATQEDIAANDDAFEALRRKAEAAQARPAAQAEVAEASAPVEEARADEASSDEPPADPARP